MMRWVKVGGLGLLGVLALVLLVLIFRFVSWRSSVEQRLAQKGTVVQTPLGAVEYGEMGTGVPILMLHGTPGGYDTILNLSQVTTPPNAQLRIIAPSRPGYLRTPIASGKTPEQQARLYAALLDTLGIRKVFVMGASGGGPSALQFAILYPERCSGLILEAAVTQRIVVKEKTFPPLLQDFLLYLFRDSAIKELQSKDPSNPDLTKIGMALFESLIPAASRAVGTANDYEQFAHIDNWALEKIQCPTLIIQGTADKDVPLAHAEFAHSKIAKSELVRLEGVDHSMFFSKYRDLYNLLKAFVVRNH